jgi:hypothetical protein
MYYLEILVHIRGYRRNSLTFKLFFNDVVNKAKEIPLTFVKKSMGR